MRSYKAVFPVKIRDFLAEIYTSKIIALTPVNVIHVWCQTVAYEKRNSKECGAGLPDFSWSKHTKTGKKTKWP
jgi:hypothetical protein